MARQRYIAMGYRIYGRGMTRRQALRHLERFLARGTPLPANLRVIWEWQNGPDLEWQSGDVEEVWSQSKRGGFRELMLKLVREDLARERQR